MYKYLFLLLSLNLLLTKSFVFEGSTRPLNFFDPLRITDRSTNNEIQKYRESEVKHGRIAMVSCIFFPIIEKITNQQAIHLFDNLDNNLKISIISLMFMSEFQSILLGWKPPLKDQLFELYEEYQPGDLGFKLTKDFTTPKNRYLLNKELNNGRLAMIASLGMIVQELLTNKVIF